MITRETIQARIEQLTAARERIATEANMQLSAHNGAIEALSQLLEETAEQPPVNGAVSRELAGVLHE
jgi:hypothetical protein